MTISPSVELRFNPTDLRPQDLHAGKFLGSPAEAIEAALAVARAAMVDQMKAEIRGIAEPTQAQLLAIADAAWQISFWRFRKMSAPVIADAYIRAYRRADAGDVPNHLIFSLADQHAEKIGAYFHESSRTALAEGFSTQVNRRIPAKAAAMQVLDAYGLSPRQMRGFNAATATFTSKVVNVLPRPLKARARDYIEKAFTSRVKKLSVQEEHNIDQQAQQFAWMWLQDKGRLHPNAQKLWITARDERVCKVCGPLHGVKVGVNERFRTAQGEFWTPGLHPNCRCVVRLIENRFSKALTATALADFNEEHPRGYHGRFTETEDRPLGHGPSALARTDEETKRLFEEIVSRIPPTGVGTPTVGRTPFGARGYVQPIADFTTPVTPAPPEVVAERPVVTARGPVAASTRPQAADIRPKAADTRPKAAAVTRPKAGLLVPHRIQVLEAKIRSEILARARTRTPPDTQTVTTRQGTKKITNPENYVPVLINIEDISPGGRYVELRPGMEARSAKSATETAAEDVRLHVERVTEEIEKEGADFVVHNIANYGKRYELDKATLREVVDWSARRDISEEENALRFAQGSKRLSETPMLTVREIDHMGKPVLDNAGEQKVEFYSAGYVARNLGIQPKQFSQPQVVMVDKDRLAQGGTFRIERGTFAPFHDKYNIPIRHAEPAKQKKKRD